MAKLIRFIQEDGGKYFEDEAAEWKAKTVANDLAHFKTFFVALDNIIRDHDTHKRTKANDTGFHSTNSAKEVEDRLEEKFATTILAFAQATKDTINQVLGASANVKQTEAEKITMLKTILELTKEIAALKKKSNQMPIATDSGGSGDASGGDIKKKKCKHCGRAHLEKTPEVLCFERP